MRFLLDKDEPNTTIDSQSSIVDFTDAEFQQSDVVPTEEECLAHEVLHLDTMMPDLSNVPASTPAETPRASSIKRKRHQEDPRIEEAFIILKKANKNMKESTEVDMLRFLWTIRCVSKIKKYSAQAQLIVEHEINKIFCHTNMGCYDGPQKLYHPGMKCNPASYTYETYAKKLGDGWLNIKTDNFVLCYRLDNNQCPSIVVSMKIYKDLTVEILHDSVMLKTKSYHFILGEHNKCDRWTKFDSLLSSLAAFKPNDVKPNEKIENVIHLIKDAYSQDDSDKTTLQSKLQDLKDIYETEKSNLIKNAPKLSQKVLYPTSFEKQNVLLALNIFHESNSAALAHEAGEKGKDTKGTKEFIDQFLKWWNIVNVKNSEKGKRLKNPFCDPIRSKDQMSMVFLNKFYDWLVSWNNKSALLLEKGKELGLPGKGGKLTKETQFALQFTTKSLIDILNHIFKEHTPEYILLEKKGEFHIKSLEIFEATSETSVEFEVDEELYEVFDTTTDVEISPEEMPAFIYISGYVAKKVSQKLNCDLCT
ncbi:hypothetical protein AVEN_56197-1 [Araneus ventricosus]|uniref:Uncharacterized protein n=1 Tax=Araneus ventricosus TaxID=182803 RepID=A0A4Y2P388_ARAVE|nr:hypothetical protein AVEN_56197-1 [Araneus ventricosus]